jgi:hypothetical protein
MANVRDAGVLAFGIEQHDPNRRLPRAPYPDGRFEPARVGIVNKAELLRRSDGQPWRRPRDIDRVASSIVRREGRDGWRGIVLDVGRQIDSSRCRCLKSRRHANSYAVDIDRVAVRTLDLNISDIRSSVRQSELWTFV